MIKFASYPLILIVCISSFIGCKTPAEPKLSELPQLLRPDSQGPMKTSLELYGVKNVEHLKLFKDWGFTQVVIENSGLFEHAEELEIQGVQAFWWSKKASMESIVKAAKVVAPAANLVSLNMMDEPVYNNAELHPPELYHKIRLALRSADVIAPLSLTLFGPKPEWPPEKNEMFKSYLKAIDVLRIDPYPIVGGRALRTVYDWSRLSQAFMKDIGKKLPLTVILQAWSPADYPDGTPQLPSYAQLRNMAYQAFYSGADTVSFFSYDPAVWEKAPGFLEAFKSVVSELKWLQSLDQNPLVQMDRFGVLRVRSKNPKDPQFDINTNEIPVSGLREMEIRRLK
jgi:hypothetical protein